MADDTIVMTDKLRAELAGITSTQRAAVLMLLLGEEQAAEIIKYLNPKEVQALGAAMVQVANFSQEAVNYVLDEFVDHLKNQNNVSIGGGTETGGDAQGDVLAGVDGIIGSAYNDTLFGADWSSATPGDTFSTYTRADHSARSWCYARRHPICASRPASADR